MIKLVSLLKYTKQLDRTKSFLTQVAFRLHNAFMEGLLGVDNQIKPTIIQMLDEANLPTDLYTNIYFCIQKQSCGNHHNSFLEELQSSPGGYCDQAYLKEKYSKRLSWFLNDVIIPKVLMLYNGLCDVLFVTPGRLPKKINKNWDQNSSTSFLIRWLIFYMLDIAEEKWKFHTNYLVCSLLPFSEKPKSDLYEGELPGVVFNGWVRKFFSSPNVEFDLKLQVALGLQNVKRACAPVSIKKQYKAVFEHQQALSGKTYKPTANDPDQDLVDVQHCLSELVRIYYSRTDWNKCPDWRFPSLSSCWEKTEDPRIKSPCHFFEQKTKAGIYTRVRGSNGKIHYHRENGDVISHVSDLKGPGIKVPIFSFGFNLDQLISDVWDSNLEKLKEVMCSYNMVLEPFKVRSVTSGESIVYQLGRMIQPLLHKELRDETGPFRFIGKKNNVDDMRDVYQGSILWNKEIWEKNDSLQRTRQCIFIVSGDFKAATDNMHPWLPNSFIEKLALFSELDWKWIKVLKKTLGSHIINYQSVKDRLEKASEHLEDFGYSEKGILDIDLLEDYIKQTHGQLMGSPTSFPVLCLVNAAILWQSWCEYWDDEDLSWNNLIRHCRPLINGDDISFLSNPEHYAIWKRLAESCGLSLSVGKNYCARQFVNINSTTYIVEGTSHCYGFFYIDDLHEMFVVNPGLIRGQSKVLSDDRAEPILENGLMPVVDQLQECCNYANENQKTLVYSLFHNHLKTRLSQSLRCWSLPRLFGGLGLPFGNKPSISEYYVCKKQIENYSDLSDIAHGLMMGPQASDYQKQILESLSIIEDFSFQPKKLARILSPNYNDVKQPLYEVPDLSRFFLNTEDRKKYYSSFSKGSDPEFRYRKLKQRVTRGKDFKTFTQDLTMVDEFDSLNEFSLSEGGTNIPLTLERDDDVEMPTCEQLNPVDNQTVPKGSYELLFEGFHDLRDWSVHYDFPSGSLWNVEADISDEDHC